MYSPQCDVKHCRVLLAAQGESAPTSVAEFEALVLSSGDSSFVWVKYMAFLVSLGDVEKARALGHRALGVINYRCGGWCLFGWTGSEEGSGAFCRVQRRFLS